MVLYTSANLAYFSLSCFTFAPIWDRVTTEIISGRLAIACAIFNLHTFQKSLHLSLCRGRKRENIGQVFMIFDLSIAIHSGDVYKCGLSLFSLDYIVWQEWQEKKDEYTYHTYWHTATAPWTDRVSVKNSLFIWHSIYDVPWLKVHRKSAKERRNETTREQKKTLQWRMVIEWANYWAIARI